jgi:hypothetical protein
MGLDFSKLLASTPPDKPKTVLVPPMFERDLKARSRMVKSSYDYLFAKPSLRWLFGDYMGQGLNTVLRKPRLVLRNAHVDVAAGSLAAAVCVHASSRAVLYCTLALYSRGHIQVVHCRLQHQTAAATHTLLRLFPSL